MYVLEVASFVEKIYNVNVQRIMLSQNKKNCIVLFVKINFEMQSLKGQCKIEGRLKLKQIAIEIHVDI